MNLILQFQNNNLNCLKSINILSVNSKYTVNLAQSYIAYIKKRLRSETIVIVNNKWTKMTPLKMHFVHNQHNMISYKFIRIFKLLYLLIINEYVTPNFHLCNNN